VREVRDGQHISPDAPKSILDPLWMSELNWPTIIHDLGLGHPLKFLWEERAQHLTTYSNFWKQFYRKFPQYREASVTAREFEPGDCVEVDYAGDPIEWIDIKTGEIRKAWVFVAGLGFSQLLYAWAAEDMKSRNWLAGRLPAAAGLYRHQTQDQPGRPTCSGFLHPWSIRSRRLSVLRPVRHRIAGSDRVAGDRRTRRGAAANGNAHGLNAAGGGSGGHRLSETVHDSAKCVISKQLLQGPKLGRVTQVLSQQAEVEDPAAP